MRGRISKKLRGESCPDSHLSSRSHRRICLSSRLKVAKCQVCNLSCPSEYVDAGNEEHSPFPAVSRQKFRQIDFAIIEAYT